MSALTVLVIRHGEKPDPTNPAQNPGYTAEGFQNTHSLNIRGWQRAGAWCALFGAGLAHFPKPDWVYAAKPVASQSEHGLRASQTVQPLCDRLHISSNVKRGVCEEKDVVEEVQGLTGVVLICWENKRIIAGIAPELIQAQRLPHLPTKWSGTGST